MHVLITGSNGLVGASLVNSFLRTGDRVTTLVRGQVKSTRDITQVPWDPGAETLNLALAGDVDAIVHLAGASIGGKRWTPQYKAEIRDSRVHGTRFLSKAIAEMEHRPAVMVVASAMGIYGDRGDEILTEDSAPGDSFLADVAVKWERSADSARNAGIRVVNTRFANILARNRGMVPRLKLPYLTGLAGKIGSGQQWWPWVALEDVARAIRFVIDTPDISGPVNVCAPGITRQKEFTKAFASALNRPSFMPLPAWAAKLVVGGLAEEGLLASRHMVPQVLEQHGFKWLGPDLETVFHHILCSPAENEWR